MVVAAGPFFRIERDQDPLFHCLLYQVIFLSLRSVTPEDMLRFGELDGLLDPFLDPFVFRNHPAKPVGGQSGLDFRHFGDSWEKF